MRSVQVRRILRILSVLKALVKKPLYILNSILRSPAFIKFGFAIVATLIFMLYQSRKTKIIKILKKTEINQRIIEKLTPMINAFKPTFWLPTAETQMLHGNRQMSNELIKYELMTLKTEDGELLPVDFYPRNFMTMNPSTPIVAFVLGACGNTRESYCKIITQYVSEKGWRIAVLNRRGFSDHGSTSKFLALDDYNDLHLAITKIHEIFSEASIYLMGVSAGANHTARYLGIFKDKTPVRAYMSISNPFNIGRISFSMKYNFWGNVFSRFIIRDFKKVLDRNMKNPIFQEMVRMNHQCCDKFSMELDKLHITWKVDKYFTSKSSGLLKRSGKCIRLLLSYFI